VLDPFVGGGTTLIESRLLGRNAIGYDVNPYAVLITKKQLSVVEKEAKRQKRRLPAAKIRIANHDSRSLATLKASSIDLICTHPPYFNSLRYTRGDNRDLSSMDDLDSFIQTMGGIAREFLRVLKAGRMCAIMMGDVRIDGKIYPLGFETMEAFKNAGFVLSEIVIKRQFNDRSSGFYTKSRFLRISHEYLFIFRKKAG
jgi:DNA modification methylase